MNKPAGFKTIPVKTWYLTFDSELPKELSLGENINIKQWKNPSVEDYLHIYTEVGCPWGWSARLLKSAEEMTQILQSKNNEVWLFHADE